MAPARVSKSMKADPQSVTMSSGVPDMFQGCWAPKASARTPLSRTIMSMVCIALRALSGEAFA
ncbi:hypothetical protein V8352_20675 [Roseovarius sp. D0-M9]